MWHGIEKWPEQDSGLLMCFPFKNNLLSACILVYSDSFAPEARTSQHKSSKSASGSLPPHPGPLRLARRMFGACCLSRCPSLLDPANTSAMVDQHRGSNKHLGWRGNSQCP